MEKRYQVFISSTFEDLKEKRAEIAEVLRLNKFVPIMMENFTPTGETQTDIIHRAIDKCDCYVLIVGGRYGSLNNEGISYTEAEYNYAKAKNLPVLAFIHNEPEALPVINMDNINPEQIKKLQEFREKLKKSYYVCYWDEKTNLSAHVAASVNNTKSIRDDSLHTEKSDDNQTLNKLGFLILGVLIGVGGTVAFTKNN